MVRCTIHKVFMVSLETLLSKAPQYDENLEKSQMALSLRTRGWPYHVEQTISLSDICNYKPCIQKGAF